MGNSLLTQFEEAEVNADERLGTDGNRDDIAIPQRLKTSDDFGDVWKISVPREKDILWSIALSFLNQVKPEQYDHGKLHTISESDLVYMQTRLNNHNPFEKSYSCFSDQGLNYIISQFHKLLTSDAGAGENTNGNANGLQDEESVTWDRTVQKASRILACEIKVYSQRNGDCSIKPVFTSRHEVESLNEDICIIILDENLDLQGHRFSFCLKEQNADQLQLAALVNTFNLFSVKQKYTIQEVETIYNLRGAKANLLISLLHYDYDIVRDLYTQPPHIFERLSKAGFVTDPKSTESDGNGRQPKTAFYYATLSEDFELLYQLYDYATCAPNWSMTFNRIPSEAVLQNYDRLTPIIESAAEQLKSAAVPPVEKEIYLSHITQIYSIHKFQRELYEHLRQIFDRRQNGSDPKEIAEMRRDILLAVMDVYGSYFNGPDFNEGQGCTNYDLYEKYSYYFYYIDFFGALKFFDHSFALKDVLSIEGDLYEEMESAFCRLYFFSRYLANETDTTKKEYNRILNHLNRLHFEAELREFKERLRNAKGKVTSCLPEKEIDVLKSAPEIKDEFIFCRLKRYLHLAADLSSEIDDKTKLLITLRSVQVLGESVKICSEVSPSLMRSLLVSNFSPKLTKCLNKIRDGLSHYDKKILWARCNIENEAIYEGVRNELKELELELEHIEEIQAFRIRKWVLTRILELARKKVYEISGLDEAVNHFEEEMRDLQLEFVNDSQKLCEKYEEHFQNHFTQIRSCFSEEVKTTKPKDFIQIINARLDCYKELLHFLLLEFSNISPQEHNDAIKTGECKNILDELGNGLFRLSDELIIESCNFRSEASAEAEENLTRLSELKEEAFRAMGFRNGDTDEANEVAKKEHSCYNIEILHSLLKCYYYFSKEEEEKICSSVDPGHRKHHDTILNLLETLKSGKQVSQETLETELQDLVEVKEWEKERLELVILRDPEEGVRQLEKLKDPYGKLISMVNSDQLPKSRCEEICNALNLSDEIKNTLMKKVKSERNFDDKALIFLKERISHLKRIIIDYLGYSKETVQDVESRLFEQHKLLISYVREEEVQTAVEFLIFDCWNVLKSKRADLKHLWTKTNCLFSGINLRHVLGHGNPLLDAMGLFLDPWDLSNEIVEKVLEIVSDCEAVEAMCKLQDETRDYFPQFVDLIKNCERKEYEDLCEKIRSCQRWEDYCFLVPGKKKRTSRSN